MKQISNAGEVDAVKRTLQEFLRSQLGIHHLQASDDLFALGLMSSLLVIQLVAFVENEFGILLKDDDLKASHFRTVDSITTLISSKNEGKML